MITLVFIGTQALLNMQVAHHCPVVTAGETTAYLALPPN